MNLTLLCLDGEFGTDEEDVSKNFRVRVCDALDHLVTWLGE